MITLAHIMYIFQARRDVPSPITIIRYRLGESSRDLGKSEIRRGTAQWNDEHQMYARESKLVGQVGTFPRCEVALSGKRRWCRWEKWRKKLNHRRDSNGAFSWCHSILLVKWPSGWRSFLKRKWNSFFFRRKLPKTVKFLEEELGTIVLNGESPELEGIASTLFLISVSRIDYSGKCPWSRRYHRIRAFIQQENDVVSDGLVQLLFMFFRLQHRWWRHASGVHSNFDGSNRRRTASYEVGEDNLHIKCTFDTYTQSENGIFRVRNDHKTNSGSASTTHPSSMMSIHSFGRTSPTLDMSHCSRRTKRF